jgi:hypothetical protein
MSDSDRERYQQAIWQAMNRLAVGGMSDAAYRAYQTLEELARALEAEGREEPVPDGEVGRLFSIGWNR